MLNAAFLKLNGGPIRFNSVNGYDGRTNDILYSPPIHKPNLSEEHTAVVYFGGDVQDFPENMETNFDSKGYIKYNLESTALLLRNEFPKSHIIVIRPARMEFNTFSCFDNFVRGNSAGVPDHTPMNHALQHLEKLLQNLSQRIKSMTESDILQQLLDKSGARSEEENDELELLTMYPSGSIPNNPTDLSPDILQADITPTLNHTIASELDEIRALFVKLWFREENFDKTNLILIGFSKGCVVLNQFIYEFHYLKTLTPDDSTMMRLVSRIKNIYWLDGGHGGSKNIWITSRSLLETLTRLNMNIHVHVTPYQVQDERRPWIKKEEKNFTELLRRLGAPLTRILHFESKTADLYTHFDVLRVFTQPQQQTQTLTEPKETDDKKLHFDRS